MLRLESFRFKNILSFGDMWTEIDLKDKRSILIQGENGTGKSACILDTLCFGLYGKPFRKIPKPKLVNYRNKRGLLVEVNFLDDHNKQYKIVRGINPGIFEIYEDEKLIPQPSDIRDYQRTLETQILKLDFQSFTQIVILGKATYVAFLRLTAADRRRFLETILNLTIFSRMNEINKAKFAVVKNELGSVQSDLGMLNHKIEYAEKSIKTLREEDVKAQFEFEQQIHEEIDNIQQLIDENEVKINHLSRQVIDNVDDELEELNSSLEKCLEFQSKMGSTLNRTKKKRKFFQENEVCPTCEHELEEDMRRDKAGTLVSKENELISAQQKLNEKMAVISQSISHVQEKIRGNRKKQEEIRLLNQINQEKHHQISLLDEKLQTKQSDHSDIIKSQEEELDQFKNEQIGLIERKAGLTVNGDCHEFINDMLKDTGIKSTIIKNRIPKIQEIMNKYLQQLGLFARFELNEQFEETLYTRGMEPLVYQGFSEGEKLRIDLAMLMTWREICKIQANMAFNILIFDEILDASIDENGADNLVTLFRKVAYDNTKIIVISHSAARWEENFGDVWKVVKSNGFSKIVTDAKGAQNTSTI